MADHCVPGVKRFQPGPAGGDVIVGVGREELVGEEENAVGGDPFRVGVTEPEENAALVWRAEMEKATCQYPVFLISCCAALL